MQGGAALDVYMAGFEMGLGCPSSPYLAVAAIWTRKS